MDDTPIVRSLVVGQHTPGTWSVSRDGVPFGGTDINVVSKTYRKAINADHVIASIRTVSDQWESNAALIAAAPELLAALHGVLHWAECECKSLAKDTPANDESRLCDYCVARAAISKAEGRVE